MGERERERQERLRAEILAIGEELVLGQSIDSNSAYLARALALLGYEVWRFQVVGDQEEELAQAIASACSRSAVVVATGGLGPTEDDRTRQSTARAAGEKLVYDAESWQRIQARFERLRGRGTKPAQSNERQAWLPAGARVLHNDWGTAPGFALEIQGARFFALPGVPREMEVMWQERVLPELEPGNGLTFCSLHVLGCTEAALGERLEAFMGEDQEPRLGITAHSGLLTVRLAGSDAAAVEARAAELRPLLGELLVYEGEASLAETVGRRLIAQERTLAVAESCTGGLLSAAITDVPGISQVFLAGWTTYSNAAKLSLGVPAAVLEAHGAVSEAVAGAMAQASARASGAQLGVGITGIAGPGGGCEKKPVGTVCFGLAAGEELLTLRRKFGRLGRDFLRRRAVQEALCLIHRHLAHRA